MEKNELPHTIGRQIIETETKWIPLANIQMVFSATFNNISAISWRSVLLVDETRGPGNSH
jgi:hypothetical protein